MPSAALVSNRPGLRFQRRVHAARNGLVHLEQRIQSRGVIERAIVTGEFWIFAAVTEETGLTEARTEVGFLPWPRRRVFLIPPRSLLRLRLSDVCLASIGVISRVVLPAPLACAPCVAALADGALPPCDLEQICAALAEAVPFDPDAGVSAFAREARQRLHQAVAHPSPVREVARAMRVAPDTVTRLFRSAYCITPKAYVQSARISDAVLSLTTGASVLRAACEAGFNDLSRFYQAFRRLTGNTPGQYAVLHDRKAPRP
jgi:AraC-like DNA-binding protein